MFYSKSTGGFYSQEIHGDNIPADAVEISTEAHAMLLAGQSAGKLIVADANGYPILEDAPVVPWSAEPTLAKAREAREVVLNRLAGIALTALASGDQVVLDSCLSSRAALLDLTTTSAVVAAVDDASLQEALVAAYAGIVATAHPNVVTAFRDFRA